MSLYKKLKIENPSQIEKIESAAAEAIDYAAKYYEFAVSNTYLSADGMLRFEFVEGQNLTFQDKRDHSLAAQENFETKFAELMNENPID